MKYFNAVLFVMLLAMQYPLWFKDKAGWFSVWEQQKEVQSLVDHNKKLQVRNAALEAEVNDLRNGTDAIEERARNELGMIHKNEVFIQILTE